MAEQFLTLMADFEQPVQDMIGEWYGALQDAGFPGIQTHGLPFHISMATFPLEREQEAIELTKEVAAAFAPIDLHMSHVGLFPGVRTIFAAPEGNESLMALRRACGDEPLNGYPWTPHATILMDEKERVYQALPILMERFRPFMGKITHLHLCAFWPTREIITVPLTGKEEA